MSDEIAEADLNSGESGGEEGNSEIMELSPDQELAIRELRDRMKDLEPLARERCLKQVRSDSYEMEELGRTQGEGMPLIQKEKVAEFMAEKIKVPRFASRDTMDGPPIFRRDSRGRPIVYKKTDAFGQIYFPDTKNTAKYVRMGDNTPMETVEELLFSENVWNLPCPRLIISVAGGAKKYHMQPRLRDIFYLGLTKAAAKTDAWVISGGMNVGVMAHVGKAARRYNMAAGKSKLVTLGIAGWGNIAGRDDLVNTSPRGLDPVVFRPQMPETPLSHGVAPLDGNHTHFIMVDDLSERRYRTELKFRKDLLVHFSRRSSPGTVLGAAQSQPTPCVVLLLEGGETALETVYDAVTANIPVVVIQGSGRVADILSDFLYQLKERDSKDKAFSPEMVTHIRSRVQEIGKNDEENAKRVMKCLHHADLFTVSDILLNDEGVYQLDYTILEALMKANKNNVLLQLKLSLAWGDIGIAKDLAVDTISPEDLEAVMFTALKEDKCDYVRLLLENGVSLYQFLTVRQLLELYRTTNLAAMTGVESMTSLRSVAEYLDTLVNDTYTPLYSTDHRYLAEYTDPQSALERFEEPWRELFIWSVLQNRRDMALLFLTEGRDMMAGCLLAVNILKTFATLARERDVNQAMRENANFFKDISLGMLNEGYQNDAEKAQRNLFRRVSLFGGTTALELAFSANNRTFISHPCCVTLLNSIWFGYIDQSTSLVMCMICVAIPLLAPALVKYKLSNDPVAADPDLMKPVVRSTMNKRLGQPEKEKLILAKGGVTSFQERIEISRRGRQQGQGSCCFLYLKHYFTRLLQFWQCPVNKFAYNGISYLVFLALYFYTMNYHFVPWITAYEIVLIVWVATLFLEELRQACEQRAKTFGQKLLLYFRNYWNILDALSILLFTLGIALKNSGHRGCFRAARFLLAIDSIFFAIRVLHYTTINKSLGPKVIMIYRMLKDLFVFLFILVVFVVSFGFAQQIMLYPTDAKYKASISVFSAAMSRSYFQMFGELSLDEMRSTEGDGCTTNATLFRSGTLPRCPNRDGALAAQFLLAVYLFIVQVLLLNLLIAIFSNTYSAIQADTEKIWRSQRFEVIREFWSRPALAPPLIIFGHLFRFVRFLSGKCCGKACRQKGCKRCLPKSDKRFMLMLNEAEDRAISTWALLQSQEYLRVRQETERHSTGGRLVALNDKVGLLLHRMDYVERRVNLLLLQQQLPKQKVYRTGTR